MERGVTIRETTAKHQRAARPCKGKGNPCSEVRLRTEEQCGKGTDATLSKLVGNRSQNKAKSQRHWTSAACPWAAGSLHRTASWGTHQTFPDLRLLPWPADPTPFESQVASLGDWQWHKPSQGHVVAMHKDLFTRPVFAKLSSLYRTGSTGVLGSEPSRLPRCADPVVL